MVDGENRVSWRPAGDRRNCWCTELVVEIPGLGTLRIRGPVTDYDSIRREADTHNAKLIQIGGPFGTTDLEKLEALHLNAVDLESQSREIASAQSALISGSTEETLNAELEQLNNRAAAIIADQPSWADAHPNAIDLEAAAAECVQRTRSESLAAWESLTTAQRALAGAVASRDELTSRRDSLSQAIVACKQEEALLSGQVSDDARQQSLQQAAMDRLGSLGALQSIENELAAFTADPSDSRTAIGGGTRERRVRVQASRDALIEAERRVLEIAGRAPYAQLAEVYGRREKAEADCRREQIKMDALTLLRTTMLDVKEQLLDAVVKTGRGSRYCLPGTNLRTQSCVDTTDP